jgi:prepilin-type N-terminal cleavage/methylation domain-containing protein
MLKARRSPRFFHRGFTLMELVTVILIIAILAAMIIPAFAYMRSRAERTKCITNLKSLYVAAAAYVLDTGHWPQIDATSLNKPEYPDTWVKTFERYNLSEQNWVCPSVQRLLKNPDLTKRETRRVDYIATDMHGDGPLLIFASGQVKSLREVLRDSQFQNIEFRW